MPEFILPWQESAAAWLVTYLLHSSLLLGSVWLLSRLNLLPSNELRETLWKAALIGGLLTASLQAWWGYQPVSGTFDLLRNPAGLAAHWLHLESSTGDRTAGIFAPESVAPDGAAPESVPPETVAPNSGGSFSGSLRTAPPYLRFHQRRPLLEKAPLEYEGRTWGSFSESWSIKQRRTPSPADGPALELRQRTPQAAGPSGAATFVFKFPGHEKSDEPDQAAVPQVIPLDVETSQKFNLKLRPQSRPWVRGALWAWLLIGGFLGLRVVVAKLRLGGMLVPRKPLHGGPMRVMLDELCHSAETSYVMLSVSDSIASPLAVGREICIPRRAQNELTAQQQKGLLAHELAHILRRDSFWLFFSALVQSVFFFQPLNRLARRRLCEESEYLCDDWAVRQVGEGRSLARCLAEVAIWIEAAPAPALAAAMAGRDSAIVSRVRRLVGETPRPRRMGLWSRSAAGLLLLALVAGMAPAVNAASGVRVLFQGIDDSQPAQHFFFRMNGSLKQTPLILRGVPAQEPSSQPPKAKIRYFL